MIRLRKPIIILKILKIICFFPNLFLIPLYNPILLIIMAVSAINGNITKDTIEIIKKIVANLVSKTFVQSWV